MALTPLVVPKRNQVNLGFTGPWRAPPDGSETFSTWSDWGSNLGGGGSRVIASGYNDVIKFGGVWRALYNINIVNADNSFYGAHHNSTGTTSALGAGTGAYLTDDALNFKLFCNTPTLTTSSPIGMLSVDLTPGSVIDGGDTVTITINNDGYMASHNAIPMLAAWENFSVGFGVSWLSPSTAGTPASDGFYALTDETDTKYNAFENDADYFLSRRWSHNTTDGTWNYTVVSAPPKSGTGLGIQLYKWQAETIGGSFTQTNYALQLDDTADDDLFQDFIVYNTSKPSGIQPIGASDYAVSVITNNQNTQISGGVLADANIVRQTMFCFAPDYSWYDRIDITSDGTLEQGFVFMDLLGDYYLGGSNSDGAFYSPSSGTPPVDSGRPQRGWTFTQDDHDFYILRLIDETYVFDKLTSQWCQWASPGLTYFSGSDGCDWQGFNVCCDPVTGDIHKIDPTGRLDGGDTPISTRIYGFVTARFRKNVPMFMAEAAISEGRPPTGVDATSLGITLRTSDTLTWTNHGTVPGKATGNMVTARWYGLGVASAPGVEFELTDTGYARRLDGFTIELGAAAEAAISNGQ